MASSRGPLTLAILPGDGIGPEVVDAALDVLEVALAAENVELTTARWPVGWAAVLSTGSPLPDDTLEACRTADAVLLGAVGHPDADGEPAERRPEAGLLGLRKGLGCWANLRPARVPQPLLGASALRPERVRGTDLLIVRELGGGLYYGEPRGDEGDRAFNTMVYTADEVRRIARLAFELAAARGVSRRRGRVTSVDKANVLETSRLWRRVVDEVAADHGGVELDHMLVDRAAMELVVNPTRFDVLLTENLFGDVLSDQAAGLVGSLGVLGSASLGGVTDLYEPVHGSAPELAGAGVANPMGTLASVCLMLRTTFDLPKPALAIEEAVDGCLADGIRTGDLAALEGGAPVGTEAFADAVIERMERDEGIERGRGGHAGKDRAETGSPQRDGTT